MPDSPQAVRRTRRERKDGAQSTASSHSNGSDELTRAAKEDHLKLAVMLHEGREIIVHVGVLEPGEARCCSCVLLLFCLL